MTLPCERAESSNYRHSNAYALKERNVEQMIRGMLTRYCRLLK